MEPWRKADERPPEIPDGLRDTPATWRRLWLHVRGFTLARRTCFATQRTLADAAGLYSAHSDRQVRRILTDLEAFAWLAVQRRGRGRTLALWTKIGRPFEAVGEALKSADIGTDIGCPHPRTSDVRPGSDIGTDIRCPPKRSFEIGNSRTSGPGGAGPPPPAVDPGSPLFDPPPMSLWAEASGAGLTLGEAVELAVGERRVARVWWGGRWWWIQRATANAHPPGVRLDVLEPTDGRSEATRRLILPDSDLARMTRNFRP